MKQVVIALGSLILALDASASNPGCTPCYENPQRINPSALPQICNNSPYFLTVEILAWQAHENGLPIAIQTENPLITPGVPPDDGGAYNAFLRNGKVKNLKFDWDPGFRIAAGHIFAEKEIDLSLTWLRLYSKGSKHLSAGNGGQLQPTQLHPLDAQFMFGDLYVTGIPPSFAFANADWHAHLNQLDFDFGRAYYVGQWLSVRPHAGLRATSLLQRLAINYEQNQAYIGLLLQRLQADTLIEGDNLSVRKTTAWWGFGPEAGLGIRLGFKNGWSLFGEATGSAEWGVQELAEKDFDSTFASILVDVRDRFRMVRPILDMQIGIAHDFLLRCQRYNLHIEAAWEQHVYYSQNQFPLFATEELVADFTSNQGDLSYQGMRFAFELSF